MLKIIKIYAINKINSIKMTYEYRQIIFNITNMINYFYIMEQKSYFF